MPFSQEHFTRLAHYSEIWRDPSDPEHVDAYNALKSDYNNTRDWAVALQKKLFPAGCINVRRCPINQGQKFHAYTWAKIFPEKTSPKELAYTVGTDAVNGFVVKLDVTTEGELRTRFNRDFQKTFTNDSTIVALMPASQGCSLSMDELVDWSIDKIRSFGQSYDDVALGLGLPLTGNALLPSSDTEDPENEMPNTEPKCEAVNRILYGPPGTGKTWSTMIHAVALATKCDLDEVQKWPRSQLREKWDDLLESRHIRFVTFHPAMTYEDFVEGLKPTLGEGAVSYELKPGILFQICDDATAKISVKETRDSIEQFLSDVAESPIQLKTLRGRPFKLSYRGNTTLSVMPESSDADSPYPVSIDDVRVAFSTGSVPETYNRAYVKPIVDEIARRYPAANKSISSQNGFVLVIDEINRGNIPAIFGELITLLEPDKRLGTPEQLKVVLPGSRKEFGIPSNLHVLGTMNTADRSVEALDTALRRRFEFVEMMPRYDLKEIDRDVEGLNLAAILRTINRRLEVLIDRDHTIGHAFLIKVNTLGDLKQAFANKIIPLLQEFFYGEWNKIGLVLGEGFVYKPERESVKFAKGFDDELADAEAVYSMVPADEWNTESFKKILAE